MDFAFSEEQQLFRDSARDFLADRYGSARVAELADSAGGWEPAVWRELARMGWLDPELTATDLALLFEETGRALLPAPWFSTVALAMPALLAAAEAGGGELAKAVAAGERSATLAGLGVAEGDLPAASTGDGEASLTGTVRFVPDLAWVTDVVVAAAGPGGTALYAVDLAANPGAVLARSTLDRTRRLGDLVLDATPARPLVPAGPAGAALAQARLRALAALSCEAVGVAQQALDLAAEHAKTRQQFGRVIGTYQAVSHQVADMYAALELARSLAYWAAWAVGEGDPSAATACAAAKSAAGETATGVCEKAIQVFGGIGFTWDHPLHRYYKRAQWIEAFGGNGRDQRADLAAILLDA
jgi:alkylation response protein AidB-like acyl-CoA dehydrogenase